MTMLVTFRCTRCHKQIEEARPSSVLTPTMCYACEHKQSIEQREQTLKSLQDLSIEKRLRLLEEWVYDYKEPNCNCHNKLY